MHVARGEHLFLKLGEDVMVLSVSKRTNTSQERFRSILQQARAANNESLSQDNIDLLCDLHLMNSNYTDQDRAELQKDSLFLFANKAPRDTQQMQATRRTFIFQPCCKNKSQNSKEGCECHKQYTL